MVLCSPIILKIKRKNLSHFRPEVATACHSNKVTIEIKNNEGASYKNTVYGIEEVF